VAKSLSSVFDGFRLRGGIFMSANTNQQNAIYRKSWCGWCKGRCGVKVYIEGEVLKEVKLDSDSPLGAFGQGCKGIRYGRGAAEFFYSEHRLKYPLKRKGSRGENKWEMISWEKALDEIAERLRDLKNRYGAETLVATAGDAWMNPDEYKTRFLNLFGSPNIIGPSPICMGPRGLVCETIFGWYPQFSVRPYCY
jgi:anaerobic selenocysteine-containing dehydrogenase